MFDIICVILLSTSVAAGLNFGGELKYKQVLNDQSYPYLFRAVLAETNSFYLDFGKDMIFMCKLRFEYQTSVDACRTLIFAEVTKKSSPEPDIPNDWNQFNFHPRIEITTKSSGEMTDKYGEKKTAEDMEECKFKKTEGNVCYIGFDSERDYNSAEKIKKEDEYQQWKIQNDIRNQILIFQERDAKVTDKKKIVLSVAERIKEGLSDQIRQLTNEKEETNNKATKARGSIRKAKDKVDRLKTELKAAKLEVANAENEIKRSQSKDKNEKTRLEKDQTKAKDKEAKAIKALEEAVAELKKAKDDAQIHIENAEEALKKLNDEYLYFNKIDAEIRSGKGNRKIRI